VSGNYAAVIGSYSVQAAGFLPVLESAGIPYMGQDATQSIEDTSKISFPLESQIQLYSSMGYAAGYNGACKSAGLLTENYGAATSSEDAYASKAFSIASGGGKVVKIVDTGSSLPDYSAPIATLEAAGAKCIIAPMPPTELGKVLQSIHQSNDPTATMAVTAASLPVSVLDQLGKQADGMRVGSAGYSVDATNNPAITTVVADVKKYDPSASINSFTIEGYAAMKILAHAMQSIKGTVNAASTMKAMGEIGGYATGIEPPYTTTKPGPLASAPRVFSLGISVYKIANGGKMTLASNGFINLAGKL
jgi:ABC-type branched-subunit amino acid transport system substrate-binding protein